VADWLDRELPPRVAVLAPASHEDEEAADDCRKHPCELPAENSSADECEAVPGKPTSPGDSEQVDTYKQGDSEKIRQQTDDADDREIDLFVAVVVSSCGFFKLIEIAVQVEGGDGG